MKKTLHFFGCVYQKCYLCKLNERLKHTMKISDVRGFDLLKFFMATMIVAIHTNAWESPLFHTLFWPFIRSAVPVFFVLSAFFYFKKQRVLGFSLSQLFHFIKRICMLYFFWFIINLPFILYQSHYDLVSNTLYGNILIVLKYLFFFQFFGYPGSWFFSGLIIGVTIITLLKRYKVPDFFVGLICLYCYVFTWWPEYMSDISSVFHQWWVDNISPKVSMSFWVALLWCFMGCLISSHSIVNLVDRHRNSFFYYSGLLLLIIYLAYIVMDGTIRDYAWMNLILVPVIVLFFYSLDLPDWNGYKLLRVMSIEIYMLHFIVLRFVRRLFPDDVVLKYFVVLLLCILISWILIRLEQIKGFKWMSYSH